MERTGPPARLRILGAGPRGLTGAGPYPTANRSARESMPDQRTPKYPLVHSRESSKIRVLLAAGERGWYDPAWVSESLVRRPLWLPSRMANINNRKRAAHRRRVQGPLQQILNDPVVMPNADCLDVVVSVRRVEFGPTVRHIFVDARGAWRRTPQPGDERPHDRYMREARARGADTYVDLTDMFMFPELTETVSRELQKRLGLLYTPVIRRLSDLGREA
jgi:hypothetical protein